MKWIVTHKQKPANQDHWQRLGDAGGASNDHNRTPRSKTVSPHDPTPWRSILRLAEAGDLDPAGTWDRA